MKEYLRWAFFILLIIFFAAPSSAFAGVVVNEIAWMGTAVSGTDEWIELQNTGAATLDLAGWMIEAADGSPVIALSGTIPAGGYFLIERTDDTTVPGITADLVAPFGNGLGNSGETLLLKDGAGAIQDTVIGGTDWTNVGGDNTTKETAQRTGGGWITATATPRAANATSPSGEVLGASTTSGEEDAPITPAPPSSDGNSAKKTSVYPRTEITVLAGDDISGLAGFDVRFTGRAFGLYDEELPNATYRWNFGDGATAVGMTVSHRYRFSGVYTAILEVFHANYRNTDRITVAIVEPTVVLGDHEHGADGYIAIENRISKEIDLGGWTLVSGDRRFVFEKNSMIGAGRSLLLPNAVSGVIEHSLGIALLTPDGSVVHALPREVLAPASPPQYIPKAQVSPSAALPAAKPEVLGTTTPERATATAATILWRGDDGSSDEHPLYWSFALLGVVLVVLAGYIIFRERDDDATAADEYAIIEDIIEGEESLLRESEKIKKNAA